MLKREIGDKGEDLAIKVLKKRGYKIIERNFNTRVGEIDIIARDKDYLVFIEVRLRKKGSLVTAKETVDIYKQRKIIKAAQLYLKLHDMNTVLTRFDVVAIEGNGADDSGVEIIKNAFWQESEKF